MSKVILITGCSSGLGREASIQLSQRGYRVFASMRNLKDREAVQEEARQREAALDCIQLDVTDNVSVERAVQAVISKAGRIDVLINNAGYGLTGALETVTMEEIREQYDTNVFGVIRCVQAVLPHMRKQKSGVIINISSVIALTGGPLSSVYASSKFAIEGLTESLVEELAPFGIRVCLIEPGLVLTRFSEENKKTGTRLPYSDNPYREMMEEQTRLFSQLKSSPAAQSVEEAAAAYIEAVEDTSFRLRFQTNPRGSALARRRFVNPNQCVSLK